MKVVITEAEAKQVMADYVRRTFGLPADRKITFDKESYEENFNILVEIPKEQE